VDVSSARINSISKSGMSEGGIQIAPYAVAHYYTACPKTGDIIQVGCMKHIRHRMCIHVYTKIYVYTHINIIYKYIQKIYTCINICICTYVYIYIYIHICVLI